MKDAKEMKSSIKGELVRFLTKDHILLHGFLARYDGRRHRDVIIHLHGLDGNFYRSRLVWVLAEFYVKNGYDFLALNTRGANTVATVYKKKGNGFDYFSGGTALEKFEDCVYDVGGAVDFCRKLGYKGMILEGHSTGCQKAVYYQAKKNDGRVSAIILLAPADDLNINKKNLGKRFANSLKIASKLAKNKNPLKQMMPPGIYDSLISADRFLSFADPGRPEAQIFDYVDGRFKLFRKIRTPMLAIFGSEEEYKTMSVHKYLKMLKNASTSKHFASLEIPGADHGFNGKEQELAKEIISWLDHLHYSIRSFL